jgi:hypothetical protein
MINASSPQIGTLEQLLRQLQDRQRAAGQAKQRPPQDGPHVHVEDGECLGK